MIDRSHESVVAKALDRVLKHKTGLVTGAMSTNEGATIWTDSLTIRGTSKEAGHITRSLILLKPAGRRAFTTSSNNKI